MTKEEQFYQALSDIFIGAPVEGESGYINLMRIKSRYYQKGIFPQLQKDIEEALKPFPDFRDELFLKLYTFFKRYFSKSGSIYFDSTPTDQNIYEKVYTDDRDVILFWKTHMLYYVKTDRLFRNLDTEIDGLKFHFDVSTLEHKKANEKRDIIYEFKEVNNGVIVFNVYYSEKGKKTNAQDILKELTKAKIKITEDTLEKAFRVFEKQSEVDYFINKNAKAFLKEQFDLWLYQYVFSGESQWTETRIKQLQVLKDIAYKIIDFISQFEDELVRIWNKPKFVLNSNYVITLDRIADRDITLINRLIMHPGFKEQVEEWKQLGIVNDAFTPDAILMGGEKSQALNPKYVHLPIDTKYFKDLELQIIGLFDDLDNSLDGWLIKSENYQALNTILPKFREKVQTIYIDPPFKTGEDFLYRDRYQDSSWLSLLENRLELARDLLKADGNIFLHLDWNADYLGRFLLDRVFGKDNFLNEIIWRIGWLSGYKTAAERFVRNHDVLLYYAKDKSASFFDKSGAYIPYASFVKDTISSEIKSIMQKWNIKRLKNVKITLKDEHWRVYKIGLETKNGEYPIEDTWNCSEYEELHSNKIKRNAKEYTPNGSQITQKPEQLLRRLIELTTRERDIVLDFFLGSATTSAVAHKLNRKWVGVEFANYFETDALYRMKHVLAGQSRREPCGISKEVNWQGGGFFKYYELEQYEDTLRRVKYEDSDIFDSLSQDPYNQYVFMRDLKMLEALEIDYENNKVKVDLQKLYPNIDIPETLSNLLGKYIKKITPNEVEFENGEKIDLNNLDYKLIKPLIWW